MLYFIHDSAEHSFKLDLMHLSLSLNEENPWFQDDINSDWSFPFSIPKSQWSKISDIANYNAKAETQFKGKLTRFGKILDATLKIQTQVGEDVSGIIFAGASQLSTFETQLKDLSLDNFEVVNIRDHALSVLDKVYPEVNHCFGMVHTDKYDPESDEFHGFEKIINKYQDGSFVENVLELETNIDTIKNIVQPLPFLMHVIQKGIQDAGYTLEGDILSDPDLNTAIIIRDGSYFNALVKESIPFKIAVDEHIGVEYVLNGIEHVRFEKELVIVKKGDYILFGDILCAYFRQTFPSGQFSSNIDILIEKVVAGVATSIFDYEINSAGSALNQLKTTNRHVDVEVSFNVGDVLRLTKIEPRRDQNPSITPNYPDAAYLELIPIRYRNPDGSPIMTVLDLNEIDLSRVVPDMTFGDLLNVIRKWKNLDFVPDGSIIKMNYIQPQLNRNNAKDLSRYDIPSPVRTFQDERTFELLFADGKAHEIYKYDSVLVSKDGVQINDYKKDKNTKEISINGLPYPVIVRNSVKTAFAFDDENSKLRLGFYRAMPEDGLPVLFDNSSMLIPQIRDEQYDEYLTFLINSISHSWEFIISAEKFKNIFINTSVYAYKNFHIFSDREMELIMIRNVPYWKVSAKTESFT